MAETTGRARKCFAAGLLFSACSGVRGGNGNGSAAGAFNRRGEGAVTRSSLNEFGPSFQTSFGPCASSSANSFLSKTLSSDMTITPVQLNWSGRERSVLGETIGLACAAWLTGFAPSWTRLNKTVIRMTGSISPLAKAALAVIAVNFRVAKTSRNLVITTPLSLDSACEIGPQATPVSVSL
jgi:hypothetical protein